MKWKFTSLIWYFGCSKQRSSEQKFLNALQFTSLGWFAILVDLIPLPNFYLLINKKVSKVLLKSLRWFGILPASSPGSSPNEAFKVTWLVCRRGWFGILFEKFDWLVSLQFWTLVSSLNIKFQKFHRISFLQTYPSQTQLIGETSEDFEFLIGTEPLLKDGEKPNVIDQLQNPRRHTSPVLHQVRHSTLSRNV